MDGTDPQVVWSIGDDSLSPRQFCDRWFADGPQHVPEFRVGVDCAATGWPQIQPGPLNASTGFAPIALTAVFDADQELASAAGITVAVDAFASHGPCPQLMIEINGLRGLYFLDPQRRSRADSASRPSLVCGVVSLRARLPQGALVAGRNRLVITTTCADEPDPTGLRQRLPGLGMWFGSAITWRRLALLRDHRASDTEVGLRPLPLFVERPDGLAELAELRVRSAGPLSDATAEIRLAGRSHEVEIRADGRHFGDMRALFPVPDPVAPGPALVSVSIAGSAITREMRFTPCRKWTVHLLPHVHLDVGFTDRPAKVTELHSRNLERAAALLATTPDFRFTIDGSYILSEFARTRDSDRAEPVLAAFRDGHLAVNAFSTLFLSGLASLEELIRSAYGALFLSENAGVPVVHAHLTDVPSYTWAIPAIVRELGIDGFLGIANHARGGNQDSDGLHLASPVRWQGPDGRDVLSFFADSYSQLRFMAADPPTVTGLTDSLIRHTAQYERDDYLPRDLPIVGTHADNEDLADDGYAELVRQWSARYAYPKLRFSTFGEYLESVRALRSRLPVIRGDGGSFWEDGAGTQAGAIATYRRAQALLPAAESLSALACQAYPGLRPDRETLDQAWHHLLFGCEHTWSAAHATGRPHSPSAADIRDWKVAQITNAWLLACDEARRGLSQLAELAGARAPALVVYNPSARTRDLVVEHELPVSRQPRAADGTAIPVELLGQPHDGYAQVRFTAGDVKPFGYRVIRLADGEAQAAAPWHSTPEVTSQRYAARVDAGTGRITSLTRRRDGRQLLDTAMPYGLGEVLYVSGGGDRAGRGLGTQSTSLNDYDPTLPPPVLTVHRCRMHYTGHYRAPDGALLRFQGAGPAMPELTLEVRLPDSTDRVELTVHVRKEAELAKEAVYITFPFAVQDPAFRYDRQLGWVEPARDHLPGACNEWFAVQNGAAMTGPSGGVVWASPDAPLVTLDLVRGTWPAQCQPGTGMLLSWVMNNYWSTNTPASQEGNLSWRYAFWPVTGWDEAAASALVRDFRTPVLADEITELDRTMDVKPVLQPSSGQLISMSLPDNADARVFTSARREHGVLVRLEEVGGQQAQVVIRHPHGAGGTAWLTTGAEQQASRADVSNSGDVHVSLGRYQLRTLVLLPRDGAP